MEFEEWVKKYKVLSNPAHGGKIFQIDDPHDKSFFNQISGNHIWTEKREAGGPKVVNGDNYVEQTGFFYVTEVPWLDGEEFCFDVSRNYKYKLYAKALTKIMVRRFDLNKVIDVPREECEVLVALYLNTIGTRWYDSTNWLVTPEVGTWKGIEVENDHIVAINLDQEYLHGTLPEVLGNLTFLRKLDLGNDHSIYETTPVFLFHLIRL